MGVPLAERIRPKTLDEVFGQQHLIGKNKPLRRIAESKYIPNMIFYGASGTGKTTIASIIAENSGMYLKKLNGTSSGVAEIKDIISELDTFSGYNGILLYLDEIQYLNKKQQQSLLEYIENGKITLIASTTENPYFSVFGAILSRCTVFEFKPLEPQDIEKAVIRGYKFLAKEMKIEIDMGGDIEKYISETCGGDVRKALNTVELSVLSGEAYAGGIRVEEDTVKLLSQKSTVIYTTSRKDLGVPEIDRKELEEFIDAIPEIPVIVRDNIKEDARIKAFDLKKRMLYDIKEFGEDNEGE